MSNLIAFKDYKCYMCTNRVTPITSGNFQCKLKHETMLVYEKINVCYSLRVGYRHICCPDFIEGTLLSSGDYSE